MGARLPRRPLVNLLERRGRWSALARRLQARPWRGRRQEPRRPLPTGSARLVKIKDRDYWRYPLEREAAMSGQGVE